MKKLTPKQLLIIGIVLVAFGLLISFLTNRNTQPNGSASSPPSTSQNPTAPPTGETVTKEGAFGCLKSNSGGTQTMDCAMGLTTADGMQYGLGSDDPSALGSIPTGTTIRVTGTLTASTSTKYDTGGIIHVTTFTKL